MKPKHFFNIISIVAITAGVSGAGDVGDAADRQQGIADRTRDVGKQIDSVVEQMHANGIETENVKTLGAIRGVLGQLSDQQMKDVVTLLRHAGETPDAGKITDANKEQQRIVDELRDLLTKYQRQAAIDAVAAKLSQLADRQNENLKASVETARKSVASDPAKFTPDVRDAVKTQQAEQANIHSEVEQAAKDLNQLVKQSGPNDPTAERLKQAADAIEANGVKKTAADATQDLNAGKLYQAATDEKATRDKLRDLAAAMAQPTDKATALRKAADQLDSQIRQEKQVADDARKLGQKLAPTTARKQTDVADQAEQTKKALAKESPAAADQIDAAEKQMQATRESLAKNRPDQAAPKADTAVEKLEQAKAEVNKELAAVTGKEQPVEAKTPAETVAALKRQEQALAEQDRHVDQAKGAEDPAHEQAALTGKTRDLQSDLVEKNPDAANALDAAAKHMNQAQDLLAGKKPRKAVDEQNQAVAELGKAAAAIDKADRATEQAKADLAATEAARDQVAEAAQKQADAEEKNADPAAAAEPAQAAQAQATAARTTDQAAKAVAAAPAPAKAAAQASTDQANREAESAAKKLDQEDAAGAKPQQQSALADLENAKNALDDQVKQAQEKLGIKPNAGQTGEAMKDVADALAKAQKAAGEAEQAMGAKGQGQGKPEAGQKLEQAAAEAAKASASDGGQMSDAGKQAMQQAEQHLRQAADQAKAGKTDQANQNAEQAKQELAAAAGESQAIASAAQQQGNKPGQGQTPGQGQGESTEAAKPGEGTSKNPRMAMTGDGVGSGVRGDVKGDGQFVGLPPRDQEKVSQSQKNERYPDEYREQVEQYLKNLSDRK